MRRSILGLLVMCCLLAAGGTASALTINSGSTDVGGRDSLVSSTQLANSNPATETAWINSVLGANFVVVYETINFGSEQASFWQQTDEIGTWAMNTPALPTHFMIKTGKIGTPDYRNFLFSNQADMEWAVVNLLDDFDITSSSNISKFSHIGLMNGAIPTPEPSTMLLLGSGIVGLAWLGRRRKQQ